MNVYKPLMNVMILTHLMAHHRHWLVHVPGHLAMDESRCNVKNVLDSFVQNTPHLVNGANFPFVMNAVHHTIVLVKAVFTGTMITMLLTAMNLTNVMNPIQLNILRRPSLLMSPMTSTLNLEPKKITALGTCAATQLQQYATCVDNPSVKHMQRLARGVDAHTVNGAFNHITVHSK